MLVALPNMSVAFVGLKVVIFEDMEVIEMEKIKKIVTGFTI